MDEKQVFFQVFVPSKVFGANDANELRRDTTLVEVVTPHVLLVFVTFSALVGAPKPFVTVVTI